MSFRVLRGSANLNIRRITSAGLVIVGMLAVTVRAGDLEYEYDALGRLIEADHVSDGKVVQYCYDAAGNRTSKIVGSSSVSCSSSGSPITIANGLTVLPQHTSFYSCHTYTIYSTYVEYCVVLGSGTHVYTQVNSDPPQYATGYSGNLVVEAAYYNTP